MKERYATGMKTLGVARLCHLHVLYEIANFGKFYFISVLFHIFVSSICDKNNLIYFHILYPKRTDCVACL